MPKVGKHSCNRESEKKNSMIGIRRRTTIMTYCNYTKNSTSKTNYHHQNLNHNHSHSLNHNHSSNNTVTTYSLILRTIFKKYRKREITIL